MTRRLDRLLDLPRRRTPPTAHVDDAGVTLSAGQGEVFELLFDDRRTWGFTPDATHRVGRKWRVPWPDQLRPHLHGTARVTVRRHHDGLVVHDQEVTLGQGGGRLVVADPEGRPLAVTKYGRLNRAFDSLAQETKDHYLDQVEEVLRIIREECGLPAFIAWGTLLGAVRDGRLIGHDVDADLAWYSDHDAPVDVIRESFVIERALRRRGWTIRRENGAFLALFLPQADGSVRNMDVFGCWRTQGWLHVVHDARARLPRSAVLPLGTQVLEGRELPAPADPPALMAAGYGEGWRVPDPSFSFGGDPPRERRMEGWLGGLRARRDAWGPVHRDFPRREAESDFARWTAERDPAEGDLLELGCGDGVDAAWFARDGRAVTAVEMLPAVVRQVRGRARKAGLDSLEVECLNLQDLRTVLYLGAAWSRRPRPTLYARGLVCDLPAVAGRDFWRLARMALRDGGSLFVEVHTEPVRFGGDKVHVWCGGVTPAWVRESAEAHGGTVVEEEAVLDLGRPARHRVHVRWDPPSA